MKKEEPSVFEFSEIIEAIVPFRHHRHRHELACSAANPVEQLAEIIGELRMDPTVEAQALADRLDAIKTAVTALQAAQSTAAAAAQTVVDTVTPHVASIEGVLGIAPPAPSAPAPAEPPVVTTA